MKKSKVIDIEEIYETDSDNNSIDSNIELSKEIKQKNKKSDKKDKKEIVEEPKPKKVLSEKQKKNWELALLKRSENREKRKKEKEEEEKKKKEILESKILLKAQRIKKTQEKVLGKLDEDLEYEKPRRIKKKVITYKSDSESSDEEIIIKKPKPKKEKIIEQPIIQNNTPIYTKVIKFV